MRGRHTSAAANRRQLAELFRAAGPKVRYRDWADRPLRHGAFVDHCHLNGPGCQELARWIDAELQP